MYVIYICVCAYIAVQVGRSQGFTPKKQIAPISRFPELSHKYRQNPTKSQENHKKTAYRKTTPYRHAEEEYVNAFKELLLSGKTFAGNIN